MNNTQLDPVFIEQIVQEVVRRLLDRGVAVSDSNGVDSNGVDSNGPSEPNADLEIENKLVTLATLRNRLNGVGRLTVDCRAVVTPAVIDHLNDRGIKLMRRGQGNRQK